MKLPVMSWDGTPRGEAEIGEEWIIRNHKGTQAVHDVVVGLQANARLGTVKTKQMGEVAGSGKKPWRQKHTGRARAGSFQSPLWRGGAVVFGPRPRDYSHKLPRKVRMLAFRKALSDRLTAGDVIVVDGLKLASHKTREFVSGLAKLGLQDQRTLVVTEAMDKNLKLATRNVPGVRVELASAVNVLEVLAADKIVATTGALEQMIARVSRS
ncbi:MAG: 50S ribosomal protein L4 [Verrucomicrobiae bacterium]|nr:50S ribosomal protein L4 [Verrucomicrobiae bacterium]MDW8344572.1 50S ribosomal protein L4 [Verrucomicrobiae bacterium]